MRLFLPYWSSTARLVGVCLLSTLSACGHRPILLSDAYSAECVLLRPPVVAPTAEKPSVVTIGLENVRQERPPESYPLVSAQLYETLIRRDCTGGIQPGLAATWKSSESGKRWEFTLRKDAYFSDGSPVTAADVLTSWSHNGPMNSPFDSVGVDGLKKLTLFFHVPQTNVPTGLISMEYAVRKEANGAVAPYGTRPFRFVQEQAPKIPVDFSIADTSGLTLQFIIPASSDERDLLDRSVDLLITRDPATINYARGLSGLITINLPWDRMYVLASTSRAHALASGSAPEELPSSFPEDLFRDAVRGDARTSRPPSWWWDSDSCTIPNGKEDAKSGPVSEPRQGGKPKQPGKPGQGGKPEQPGKPGPPDEPGIILYNSTDPVARELAERLVALSAMNATGSPAGDSLVTAIHGVRKQRGRSVSEGVPEAEFKTRLTVGRDVGYVLSIERSPYRRCSEIQNIIGQAPWIRSEHVDVLDTLIPLVDTRRRVIARKNRFGLMVDWVGKLTVLTPSRNGN